MSYWDLPQEEQDRLTKAGADYDLRACLEYNPQAFNLSDIEKVLAVWIGENDGDDWRWVIKVTKKCADKKGGRYVFLQGGCDYTGWDCQSWASSQFTKSAMKAAVLCLGELKLGDSQPYNAGLGHMLNILGGTYSDNFKEVYDDLVRQLKESKKKTWHETKDVEFGTDDLPKI